MDEQARVLWDFLNAAYRTGALDKFMDLAGAATDQKYHNQAVVFAELEDAIQEMEDFSGVDQTLTTAYQQMPALSDPETLEGLGALVSYLTPLVDAAMRSVDRDSERLKENMGQLAADLPLIGRALFTVAALNSGSLVQTLGQANPRESGQSLGRGLNAAAGIINDLNAQNPRFVPDFMDALFKTVDRDQMSRAADALTQAFLDQKPPLLRWTASTLVKRARHKLLGK